MGRRSNWVSRPRCWAAKFLTVEPGRILAVDRQIG
jgi:hypothetical protein